MRIGLVSMSLTWDSLTQCHSDSFTDFGVPRLRLLLILIMMPLNRCVTTENYLIAPFKKMSKNIFDVDSKRAPTLFSLISAAGFVCRYMVLHTFYI